MRNGFGWRWDARHQALQSRHPVLLEVGNALEEELPVREDPHAEVVQIVKSHLVEYSRRWEEGQSSKIAKV